MDGGAGNDVLFGGDGYDVLKGGTSDGSLDGGAGDDTFDGGAGIDVLFGNGGADAFVFSIPNDGGDVVRAFNAAEGDMIVIDHTGFGLSAGLAGHALPDAIFESGTGLPAAFRQRRRVLFLHRLQEPVVRPNGRIFG